MNKMIIWGGAVCILALSSCQKETPLEKENPLQEKLVPVTFTVGSENAKSSLGAENAVVWSEGDCVALFDDTGKIGQSFEVSHGKIQALVHEGATYVYSLYPYNASASVSGNVVTTFIPTKQTAVEGSFGEEVNVSVAYTTLEDAYLSFMNACALLKFVVDVDDVVSVTFTANNNDYRMSGSSSLTYYAGVVSAVSCVGGHTVTLAKDDGTALTKGATYYAAVAPQTYAGGITMTMVKSDGSILMKKGSSDLATSAGKIKSLGTLSASSFTSYDGYYAAYMGGMPLDICGELVSGADAKLVDTDEAAGDTYDIKADLHQYNGIVFVSGSKPCVLSANMSVKESERLIVVGNTPGQKISFVNNSYQCNVNTGSSVYFKNVNLTIGGNYFLSPASRLIGKVYFDDCDFLMEGGKPIMYAKTGAGAASIRATNCKFELNANVILFNMANSAISVAEKYEELVFHNNIVYSQELRTFQFFNTHQNSTSSSSEITCTAVMTNNILYNFTSNNGLIRHYQLASMVVGGNVYRVATGSTTNSKAINIYSLNQDNALIQLNGDIFYYNGSNANATFSYKTTSWNNMTSLDEDPFNSFDTATGAYSLKDNYSTYGPQK